MLNPLETLIILIFLSTLSLRRATHWSGVPLVGRAISIHALLAESDVSSLPFGAVWIISIHALLAESDNTSIAGRITSNDFYPRSPCGERPIMDNVILMPGQFLSTLSLRRATCSKCHFVTARLISIHALLAESDNCDRRRYRHHQISIHALLAESDLSPAVETSIISNFYPRSPCGERQRNKAAKDCDHHISIHALLAESDQWTAWTVQRLRHFYPRSPCGERPDLAEIAAAQGVFLSTLSLRRATCTSSSWAFKLANFYPRSPCGERRGILLRCVCTLHFYPRSPCGERPCAAAVRHTRQNFYPRSPCGERLRRKALGIRYARFLSTLSLRRATSFGWNNNARSIFLSTLSLRRATLAARDDSIMFVFLSTLSLRRATASQGADTGDKVFLSTLSLRRATHQTYQLNAKREFLSTLSLRRATLAGPSGPAFLFNFYPRSPCGERQLTV